MPLLLAKDGAKFYGTIISINGQIRASYSVILDVGADTRIQNDVKMFPTEEQASAWLHSEAAIRGFEKFMFDCGSSGLAVSGCAQE
jgi:hypothetical protein